MEQQQIICVQNYINGKFTESQEFIDSYNPATGKIWARIPDSTEAEANLAVAAAQNALIGWAETTIEKRTKILLNVADLLEQRLDEFAEVESRDQGKPIWLAKTVDIPRAVYNFRCFATSVLHHVDTSTYLDAADSVNYTSRGPVGVAVLISPWNLPLYLLTFKIAPAIACGNTVVCKPSEMTSVTAWMLCRILTEAGLPDGVVNMVFGTGPKVGSILVSHPQTQLISFTGSTATAERIRLASAPYCKKLSLELGGKNAAVIFDDTDVDKCISTTIRSSFLNQGEICLCTSRLFVQRGIFDSFIDKFVQATRNIKVGDPTQNSSWMGALISKEHKEKVLSFIKLAQDEGLKICCGESVDSLTLDAANQQGYFVQPTVIVNPTDSSRLMQEEIFGPVVCIVPFTTETEVLERVNNSKYGLCATVWTSDVGKAHRVARKLQVGTVWVNCWLVRDLHMPFGGVKSSGIGREGVADSVDFYTEVKTVCVQIGKI
jgi:acyl-CoA reductase-like NAD-dependent aldehyde dehydrogenase